MGDGYPLDCYDYQSTCGAKNHWTCWLLDPKNIGKQLPPTCFKYQLSAITTLFIPPCIYVFNLFSYLYFLLYISPHHCVSIIYRLHFPSISPHPKLRVLIMNLVGIYEQHLTNTFCILASNERHKFIPNSNANANTNVIVCVGLRDNAIWLQKYKYIYKKEHQYKCDSLSLSERG